MGKEQFVTIRVGKTVIGFRIEDRSSMGLSPHIEPFMEANPTNENVDILISNNITTSSQINQAFEYEKK